MSDEGQEPPRPDPRFRVYVIPDGDAGLVQNWIEARIDVTHAVMDVYDIAVSSMDFGSGFLSSEEVGNLRLLGQAIGAERFDYQHDKCFRCGHEYGRHYSDCCLGIRGEGCDCPGFIRPPGLHTSQQGGGYE